MSRIRKQQTADLRLTPDLVPKPLWGISAYRLFKRGAKWKSIRRAQFASAKGKCSVCEAPATLLICHEKWDYDDDHCIATLFGFEMLCRSCDTAVHFARATSLGLGDDALSQTCRINGIKSAVVKQLWTRAMITWEQRSREQWRTAVSVALLKAYPQLEILVGIETGP
jgi:hypothetical protein